MFPDIPVDFSVFRDVRKYLHIAIALVRVFNYNKSDGRANQNKNLTIWAMGNGQWAMGNGQWAMGNGQWAMGIKRSDRVFHKGLCPMPHARCPMPDAPCPMPHAPLPITHSLRIWLQFAHLCHRVQSS
ncbi:MAG: hypothetical protein KME31_13595 [Tolypothrix carrinoi HA7290-LM1]|nr:hypothetical protein [Tolypothrix carrinoi HA7290-LM1]